MNRIFEFLLSIYSLIRNLLPVKFQGMFLLLILSIFVSIIAIFIWYFYKTLSKRDLILLNLNKYNLSEHPTYSKIFAIILYFIEYILIMPLLIFAWFASLSFIIVLISSEGELQNILFLTAVLVASIRILAYIKHEISQDLAKLFPFITLSMFLLTPNAFDLSGIVNRSAEIALLSGNVITSFIVILIIEIFLRLVYTIREFVKSKKEEIN